VTPAAPELGRRLEAGSGLLHVEHHCVLYEYMKYINGDEIACILWQIFPEVFLFFRLAKGYCDLLLFKFFCEVEYIYETN